MREDGEIVCRRPMEVANAGIVGGIDPVFLKIRYGRSARCRLGNLMGWMRGFDDVIEVVG